MIKNVTVGTEPVNVAYDPFNNYVYVANSVSGTVSVINGTTVIATVNVGYANILAPAYGLGYDPINHYMYVANYFSGNILVFLGTQIVANITDFRAPYQFLFNPKNNYMYVTDPGSGSVILLSGTSKFANITGIGSGNFAIAFNNQTSDVYVASYSFGTVTVIPSNFG